jgi:hypothetical protein
MTSRSMMEVLSDFALSLRTQVAAGFMTPLDDADTPVSAPKGGRGVALCDESPGRICRNGFGSLEVGGLRDRVDD